MRTRLAALACLAALATPTPARADIASVLQSAFKPFSNYQNSSTGGSMFDVGKALQGATSQIGNISLNVQNILRDVLGSPGGGQPDRPLTNSEQAQIRDVLQTLNGAVTGLQSGQTVQGVIDSLNRIQSRQSSGGGGIFGVIRDGVLPALRAVNAQTLGAGNLPSAQLNAILGALGDLQADLIRVNDAFAGGATHLSDFFANLTVSDVSQQMNGLAGLLNPDALEGGQWSDVIAISMPDSRMAFSVFNGSFDDPGADVPGRIADAQKALDAATDFNGRAGALDTALRAQREGFSNRIARLQDWVPQSDADRAFKQAAIDFTRGQMLKVERGIVSLNGLRHDVNDGPTPSGMICRSPCGLGSNGQGLQLIADSLGRAAQYYTGGPSAELPPWLSQYNATGVSSAGADWSDYYRMFGSNTGLSAAGADWTSWYQTFGGPTGVSSAGVEGIFAGFWGSLIAELGALDNRMLADAASRAGAINGIAQRLGVEFPTVDPVITQVLASGALLDLLQRNPLLADSTGGFSNVGLVLPLLFEIFDYATVDGDTVTISVFDSRGLRGTPTTIDLTGTPQRFAPDVLPGPVRIDVYAVDEGSLTPNTGQVNILSTVTSGQTSQQFSLSTGETGTLLITAAPPP